MPKKPPQGSSRIFNPEKQESLVDWHASQLLDEWAVYSHFRQKAHPAFQSLLNLKLEGRLTDERAAPFLIELRNLPGYNKKVVGILYRYLKFKPHSCFEPDRQVDNGPE